MERLGPFQILEKLGEGGMGRVYKALDPRSDQVVALKLLTYEGQDSEVASRRFRREFRAAARLRHPHVASVFEILQDEGGLFFSMEYVEGMPLHEALGLGQQLGVEELNAQERIDLLVNVMGQVSLALDYIHANQLIHRDIKPDNIVVKPNDSSPPPACSSGIEGAELFFSPGQDGRQPRGKLLDFGLARQMDLSTRITRTGVIMGTVDYMAPEQVLGAEMDSRSDLYALGVVLYEALANRLPFGAEETFTVLMKHAYESPPPIRSSNPEVDPRLEDITFKLLSKDPQDRYQTARELLADLVAFKRNIHPAQNFNTRLQALSMEQADSSQGRLFSPRIIGRKQELRRIEELLVGTLEGQGRVMLLSGESGLGKSRLVEEAKKLARLKGVPVHVGAAYEEQPVPYGPFLVALDQVVRELESWSEERLERVLPRDARALGTLNERLLLLGPMSSRPELVELAPDQHKYRLFGVLADLMRGLGRESGRVFVLEDLQWADSLSLELIQYLMRNVVFAERELGDPQAGAPISFLLTLRDDEVDSAGAVGRLLASMRRTRDVEEQSLGRLDRDEVALVVKSMLGREEPPPELVDWMFGETQGNPLFIEEVMGGLVAEGVLVSAEGRWRLRLGGGAHRNFSLTGQVPRGIRDLIRRRLEKLDQSALKVATLAAVIGPEVPFDVLLDVTELEEDDLLDVVDELIKGKILNESRRDTDLLAFSYAKVREVLLEDVMERRKRRIHERVGRALEARSKGRAEDAIGLAHHYLMAQNVDKALEHLPHAGGLHRERFNNEEAVRCFARVLDILDDLPAEEQEARLELRLATLLALGELQSMLCNYERAMSSFLSLNTLAERHGNPRKEAQALLAQADIHVRRGDYDDAEQLTRRGLALFESEGDALGRAAGINSQGRIYWHQGRPGEARHAFEQALEIRRAEGDTYGVAISYNNIGYVHFLQGDYRGAMHCHELALEVWQRSGNKRGIARSLEAIANVAQRRGAFREGLGHLEDAQRTMRELGDKGGLGYCLISMGNTHGYLGHFTQALEYYSDSYELYTELGEIRGLSICLGNMGRVLTSLGDYRAALEHVGRSLKLARRIGEKEEIAIGLMTIGDVYREYGDFPEALRNYEPSLELFRSQGESFGLSLGLVGRAQARMQLDDTEAAKQDAREALELARKNGAREIESRARLLVAELHGRMDEAREAQALADKLGALELRAVTRALVGRLAAEVGAIDVAQASLGDSVTILENMAESFGSYEGVFLKRRLVSRVFSDLEALERRARLVSA